MADYEIHCPNCGLLLRRYMREPRQCPDCDSDQVIALHYQPYNGAVLHGPTRPRDFDYLLEGE